MGSTQASASQAPYFTSPPILETVEKWFWDTDFVRGIIVPLCDLRPGVRVLDVGCGTGAFARQIHRYIQPGGTVVGLDKNADSVQAGNAHNATHHLDGLTLVNGDARDLVRHFELASFDVVGEVGMLCNLPGPDAVRLVLGQMIDVARPGGRVYSLQIDLGAIFAEEAEIRDLTRKWMEAVIRGYASRDGRDMEIATKMPTYFHEQGLLDIKVKSYIAPEPFPPFAKETIDLVEGFRAWFEETSAAHRAQRQHLVGGGLTEDQIGEMCVKLRSRWDERISMMKAGQLPPLFTQVFLFVSGRKPS